MEEAVLKYPLKSHRKVVALPDESKELAEMLGIVYGDGGIGNPWQVVISLNSIADAEYSICVVNLVKKLFSISPALRKRPNQNTLVVVLTSTTVVDFLVQKGAARGSKLLKRQDIPGWIIGNEEYLKFFIRGLVDTDGCLYIHKHNTKGKRYANIGLCFTNYSTKLISSVAKVFLRYQLKAHVTDLGRRIYFYDHSSIERYLQLFGSSNSRIIDKYNRWRDSRVV